MKMIDRIRYSSATPTPEDVGLLLEYYEAAEAWIAQPNRRNNVAEHWPSINDRLQKARAGKE